MGVPEFTPGLEPREYGRPRMFIACFSGFRYDYDEWSSVMELEAHIVAVQ